MTASVVHRTAYDVKQFACDGLLTRLVVLQVQLAQQLVGIVGGRLHGYHSGCMLGSHAVKQGSIEHEVCHLRQELGQQGVHVGLHDEVVVERLHLFVLYRALAAVLLQVVLRLLGDDVGGEVTLVVSLQLRLKVNGQELLVGQQWW